MPDRRAPRVRGSATYVKPALSETELLRRWEDRGLVVSDPTRARRYLRQIGYYRLSAYVRTFEHLRRDNLRPGTTFDDVLELYVFDRKLRLHLLDALERVEVAVRAAVSDRMSSVGGAHWYENQRHFADSAVHRSLLAEVDRLVRDQLRRPPERFTGQDAFVSALEHYVTRYNTPARPPTWLAVEELSFGTVRNVYVSLADSGVQADIAEGMGLRTPVLTSWLLSYQRVRNICAHHGRLWNRGLGVYPAIPKSASIRWLEDRELFAREPWRRQRLFPVLVSLQTILHTISPGSSWAWRLEELLAAHPHVSQQGMGIPEAWWDDQFWPRRAAS